jgi:hypothetical protein
MPGWVVAGYSVIRDRRSAEDLAEAEELVMTLSGVQPLRSRIELVNSN